MLKLLPQLRLCANLIDSCSKPFSAKPASVILKPKEVHEEFMFVGAEIVNSIAASQQKIKWKLQTRDGRIFEAEIDLADSANVIQKWKSAAAQVKILCKTYQQRQEKRPYRPDGSFTIDSHGISKFEFGDLVLKGSNVSIIEIKPGMS